MPELPDSSYTSKKFHKQNTQRKDVPRYRKPQILKDSSTNQLRPFTLTKINDIKGKAVKNWHWS